MQYLKFSFLAFSSFFLLSTTQAKDLYISAPTATVVPQSWSIATGWIHFFSGYTLPFLYRPVTISEGRIYSDEEHAIHGLRDHEAIDFDMPYGTKIYAPTTGLVLATYQNGYLTAGTGVRAYEGKAIHYGYGYYITFWDPKRDLFMIFAHLSSIAKTIPFYPAKALTYEGTINLKGRNSGLIPPRGETIKTEILKDPSIYSQMKVVKAGEYLGTIGTSGLERWENFPLEVKKAPSTPPKKPLKSRDQPHLHFELFQKSLLSGKVEIDPYGVYSWADSYLIQ
jgi:murein DD-endopeptidase MepM/ murein hydrolase activator NlpD